MTYDPNQPPQNGMAPQQPMGQPNGMAPQQPMQPQQPMGQPAQPGQAMIDPNQIPEHLRQGSSAANELESGAAGSGPRLSIKGKQFAFVNGDQTWHHPLGQPLNVVILKADPRQGTAKKYFSQAFVEGSDQSPACYSSDGVTPDAGSEVPQCATCAACPHNKFGTARNQDGSLGKGKACKDFKRLYVVPVDQPYSDVYELHVPVTSHKNMEHYGKQLHQYGLTLHGVVTTLGFANDTSPVLTFGLGGYLDADTYGKLEERLSSGEIDTLLPSLNKTPADPAAIAGPQQDQAALPAGGQQMPPQDQQPQGQGMHPGMPQQGQPQGQGMHQGMSQQPAPQQPPQAAPAPQAPPAQAAPCPLGAPAGYRMANPNGAPYSAFVTNGWTDDLLLQHGHMVSAQ